MSRKYSSFIVALAWCCSLFATPMFTLAADSDNQGRGGRKPVKVMTRNLYLGADLLPVVSSPTLNHLLANAAATFARVEATDFPARAKLLAREICDTEPALIGLQEVALWRRGDFGVLDGPGTPATIVLYDFLQSLQSELNALGLEYSVVVAQSEFDAEVPSALGFDLRVTLRDVILARADLSPNKLSLTNPQSANYLTTFVLMTIAGPITLRRGWTSVDATMKGRSFRFINTHLESFDPQLRFGQSFELLGGPANTTLPVVLVGDLNSGPAEAGPFVAYANLLGAGFVDTWLQAHPIRPGITCCNAENLLNPAPLSQPEGRIDHVLTRPSVRVIHAKLVGRDQDNRTPAGLWPSDHAGVSTTLAP